MWKRAWLCLLAVAQLACGAPPEIVLSLGTAEDGSASAEWRDAIVARSAAAVVWEARPFSPEELGWIELARLRRAIWGERTATLRSPFEHVRMPGRVTVLVGNQHGDDGFTLGGDTVYFDASALVRNYGPASEPGNRERLDRLFDHEFTHVLHWRWAARHPQPASTPLERALWTAAREGMGNYRSLSAQWVTENGELTQLARTTLDELEPVFAERMARLGTATEDEESALVVGLSSGPFRKKWGALPVALWLAQEARGDDRHLRPWVRAGGAGILELARRHLRPDLAARLPSGG